MYALYVQKEKTYYRFYYNITNVLNTFPIAKRSCRANVDLHRWKLRALKRRRTSECESRSKANPRDPTFRFSYVQQPRSTVTI